VEKSPKKKLFGVSFPSFTALAPTATPPPMASKAARTLGISPPSKGRNKLFKAFSTPRSKVATPHSRTQTRNAYRSGGSTPRVRPGRGSPRKPIPFTPSTYAKYAHNPPFAPPEAERPDGPVKPPTPPLKDSPSFGGYASAIEQMKEQIFTPFPDEDSFDEDSVDEDSVDKGSADEYSADIDSVDTGMKIRTPRPMVPAPIADQDQFDKGPRLNMPYGAEDYAKFVEGQPIKSARVDFESTDETNSESSRSLELSSAVSEYEYVETDEDSNQSHSSEMASPHNEARPSTPTGTVFSVDVEDEYLTLPGHLPKTGSKLQYLESTVYIPPEKDVPKIKRVRSDGLDPVLLIPAVYISASERKMAAEAEAKMAAEAASHAPDESVACQVSRSFLTVMKKSPTRNHGKAHFGCLLAAMFSCLPSLDALSHSRTFALTFTLTFI
jgi:hypothetical protein